MITRMFALLVAALVPFHSNPVSLPPPTVLLIPLDAKGGSGVDGPDVLLPLTSTEDGVNFDLDADGVPERTGWTGRDSKLAFLAMDRNNNGQIDDGSELFGNVTVSGIGSAFEALQHLNMQQKGGGTRVASINPDEPLYGKLLLWEDSNHNGFSEASELQPVSPLLTDIGLGYQVRNRADGHGNVLKFRGWARLRTAPGRNRATDPSEDMRRAIGTHEVVFHR
jgi:hypothetical protein